MNSTPRYIVISPVRDEEDFVEKTILSVIAQKIQPVQYCIVDDGSKDRTGTIIDIYAQNFPWITAVHRPDRGFRNSAGGEIDAFYFGLSHLAIQDWDFIVKLDGDMSFDEHYFERLLSFFNAMPDLGMASGVIYNVMHNRFELERTPRFHVRGAAKMYRRKCWDAIKGMAAMNGWDTLDEVKANMLGWRTRSFPELKMIQHRGTGEAVGVWPNALKNGRGAYASGYHPVYLFVKCIKRIFNRPFGVESAGLLVGFVSEYLKNAPRAADRALIGYLRSQQMNRLFLRPTIWE
ncbi:MAG: glycosyltransferase [Chitinispirillaceae bacterium]|jgi:glycosyltransferase involved in cell wall biosynthesis|nr:glycosyltransferase [Chitinispirillaceae bacterium]